ncbi:MAG: YHS domain-containing (seleno)protein [Thalassobaculaceae bacterium]|nr:YHS domain-containing (seleno)protein [Thalassobaculaceae bacterium]
MRTLPAILRFSVILGLGVVGAFIVTCGAGFSARGAAGVAARPVFERGGVALGGYDTVAYFLDREPVEGSETHRVDWNGVVWHFTSDENALLFRGEPERFAPQYGGYSLYGMSRGKAYAADPRVFDIIDGKLYLSRNDAVRGIWQRNPDGYIAAADKAWQEAHWSEAPTLLVR